MDYSLKGHTLDKEDYTKYLGVELQSSLSWNRHIDQTVKKANSMLGFLRRNLRVNSEQTEATAYCSMVQPLLEYCSTVWSPYTHEYVHKLEMVQRRAARYVTNRYHNTSSVTSMLDHLDWEECACASEWRSSFSGDTFRTFLDLKTTFWLSFYYFLHSNKNSAKGFCVFLCCFVFLFCFCFLF